MKHCSNVISSLHRERLQALCALSDLSTELTIENLVQLITESPDPETANRVVMKHVTSSSRAVMFKWRQEIAGVWSAQNPHVPLLMDIPLATSEVSHAPILSDAHAFLAELQKKPAKLVDEGGEQLLHTDDLYRLMSVLPSLKGAPIYALESEWGCVALRRLHILLKTMRLVRSVKGNLIVVRSRHNRFISWPLTQQLYVLWHADTYHVSWSEFAGQWHRYVNVLQDYLPLLWDLGEDIQEGDRHESQQLCSLVMEYFIPLWEQEELFSENKDVFASVFQQCGLPGVVEKMVIHEILLKYGLVEPLPVGEGYAWTKLGVVLLKTELNEEFPCGLSLLD